MAMAGRECAAQHQDGCDQRDRAGRPHAQHEIGDDGADGVERLLDPHGRDAVKAGRVTAFISAVSSSLLPPPG